MEVEKPQKSKQQNDNEKIRETTTETLIKTTKWKTKSRRNEGERKIIYCRKT